MNDPVRDRPTTTNRAVMNLRGSEWLILLLIVLLLFGARRLPDMARGLGRSLRIFKAETKGLMNDDETAPADGSASTGTSTSADPAPQDQPAREASEPTDR
jgi:sec-independent protein translocase protein TatA